jgi:hypothetical protein
VSHNITSSSIAVVPERHHHVVDGFKFLAIKGCQIVAGINTPIFARNFYTAEYLSCGYLTRFLIGRMRNLPYARSRAACFPCSAPYPGCPEASCPCRQTSLTQVFEKKINAIEQITNPGSAPAGMNPSLRKEGGWAVPELGLICLPGSSLCVMPLIATENITQKGVFRAVLAIWFHFCSEKRGWPNLSLCRRRYF